jgi:hypothetical protein
MVAKSELLEHYEETSVLQANTDSGVPSTGAQYLMTSSDGRLCFHDDRNLGEIRDEILWVAPVP